MPLKKKNIKAAEPIKPTPAQNELINNAMQ